MKIEGWKYYIHAAIPDTSPHETVDIALLRVVTFGTWMGNHYLLGGRLIGTVE